MLKIIIFIIIAVALIGGGMWYNGKLDAAAAVTNEALIAAGVISKPRDGVKILGQGAITAKLVFEVAAASKSAIAAIEGAGGTVKLPATPVAE